jgi:formylmethanofuran dehydrogenase subunit A
MMQKVNQKALAKTNLPELDREYSLYEIAIITRAGPARCWPGEEGYLGA